jgi:hypothetical protein
VNESKLSLDDVHPAERIVSFCALRLEYSNATTLDQWDAIACVSQDYAKARDVILEQLNDLLNRIRSSL